MLPLNKKKKGIKRKIVLSICSTTLIVAALAITSGYYWAFYLLRNTVGQDHKEMAQLLASSIEEMIDAQMEQIRSVLTSVIVRNAIEVSNVGYHDLQKYAIKQMLLKRDQSWTRQGQENDIFEKYLETDAALRLRSFIVAGRDIAEIFVTDKYGGLVASSRKTSDYYQADEVWWQEAFNEGKGKNEDIYDYIKSQTENYDKYYNLDFDGDDISPFSCALPTDIIMKDNGTVIRKKNFQNICAGIKKKIKNKK